MSATLPAIRRHVEAALPDIARALPPHIAPQRFVSALMTAFQANPDLQKCTPESVLNEARKAASDGLLPDGRKAVINAYYDKRAGTHVAKYMPMVEGVIDVAYRGGFVVSLNSAVVYEGETFRVRLGDDVFIEHERDIAAAGARPIVAVYAIAILKGGGKVREVMSWAEVEAVRAISRNPNAGAWKDWPGEMGRKTVIHRLAKRLPDIDEKLSAVVRRVEEEYTFQRPDAVDGVAEEVAPAEPRRRTTGDLLAEVNARLDACRDGKALMAVIDDEAVRQLRDLLRQAEPGTPRAQAAERLEEKIRLLYGELVGPPAEAPAS